LIIAPVRRVAHLKAIGQIAEFVAVHTPSLGILRLVL
jgi:hypothetical protein